MIMRKEVFLILAFSSQLSAQRVFSPNDFKPGAAAAVYRENLALWNAAGTNSGYASILCSVPSSERFVVEVEAQKTSELTPELSIRYGAMDGKAAATFYVADKEFKTYTSDTLAGYSGDLFFVFKIGDAARRDVNIYIRRVVIKTFKATASPATTPSKTFSALFTWNANDASEEVDGYVLHLGRSSRRYDTQIKVGNVTQHQLNGFSYDTKYYVALTAYNSAGSSDYSGEVFFLKASQKDTTILPPPPPDTPVACDLNGDGKQDYADYESFTKLFGVKKYTKSGRLSKSYKAQYDLNNDEKIDSADRDLYVRQCCYCNGMRAFTAR